MTYLEAFDLLAIRARNWWFNTEFDIGEVRQIKFDVGIVQDGIIDTLDIMRMYINSNSYNGLVTPAQELVDKMTQYR